jgi:hypothetical protein
MILVLGFVWGGLFMILRKAARHERAKKKGGQPSVTQ